MHVIRIQIYSLKIKLNFHSIHLIIYMIDKNIEKDNNQNLNEKFSYHIFSTLDFKK